MRVKFLERYVHKPTPNSARSYPPGYVGDLPTAAAERAIAAGKAEKVETRNAASEAGEEAANGEAADSAEEKKPARRSRST